MSVNWNWQEQFRNKYNELQQENFLLIATPGAGKTRASLRVAQQLEHEGIADRIVVVVPTAHLKEQWANAAYTLGMPLERRWKRGPDDAMEGYPNRGIICTYAQVEKNQNVFEHHCQLRKTFVILDEFHHAGDTATWGSALKIAFGPAVRRLLLSGTPWGSRGQTLPFARYIDSTRAEDPSGTRYVEYDHAYWYGDAIDDGICRPVLFHALDGASKWFHHGKFHEAVSLTREGMSDDAAASALRTCLLHKEPGGWLEKLLTRAHESLSAQRREHREAGGLVVCIDQDHARAVYRIMRDRLGIRDIVLAISDEPKANDELRKFRDGTESWLVSVKLVSEGVDIPRLRVLAYATNVRTELYFRQLIGRVVRHSSDGDHARNAYVFLPAEALLTRMADDIKKEIEGRALASALNVDDDGRGVASQGERRADDFTTVSSAQSTETLIIPGHSKTPVIKVGADERGQLRREISTLVTRVVEQEYGAEAPGEMYASLRTRLARKFGRIDSLTVDHLREQLVYLQSLLHEEA